MALTIEPTRLDSTHIGRNVTVTTLHNGVIVEGTLTGVRHLTVERADPSVPDEINTGVQIDTGGDPEQMTFWHTVEPDSTVIISPAH